MKRNLLNIVMLILFLLTISFYFLPKILHEILGVLWFAVVLLHLFRNRYWLVSLKNGKWTLLKSVSALVNILLAVSAIAVMITGVFISNHLFKEWFGIDLARNITVHQIHVSLPFWMMILLGIHLGLHAKSLWHRLMDCLPVDKYSGTVRIVSYVCSVGILVVGIYGSFMHRIGDRLLMKHIFATKATELPFEIFLLLMLGIMGLYVIIGYVAQIILNFRGK